MMDVNHFAVATVRGPATASGPPYSVFADWPSSTQLASDHRRDRQGADLGANTGQRFDLAYLSCLPWLDFTALDNALPGPDDCIPRFSWGKFVQNAEGSWSCAVAVQVHHALVDGLQVGQFFEAAQASLNRFAEAG